MVSEVGMEVCMEGSNGDCSGGWPVAAKQNPRGLRFLQEAGRQSDIRLCGGWRVPARERGAAGKEQFRQRASGQAKIDFEGKQYAPLLETSGNCACVIGLRVLATHKSECCREMPTQKHPLPQPPPRTTKH